MNFMTVVKGEGGDWSAPLLYTHSKVAWGAPEPPKTSYEPLNVISMSRGASSGERGVDRVRHTRSATETERCPSSKLPEIPRNEVIYNMISDRPTSPIRTPSMLLL